MSIQTQARFGPCKDHLLEVSQGCREGRVSLCGWVLIIKFSLPFRSAPVTCSSHSPRPSEPGGWFLHNSASFLTEIPTLFLSSV